VSVEEDSTEFTTSTLFDQEIYSEPSLEVVDTPSRIPGEGEVVEAELDVVAPTVVQICNSRS
jgi:hypothetical protein